MFFDHEITAVECEREGGWFGFLNDMQFICCQANSYKELKEGLFEIYSIYIKSQNPKL